ncbi:MAG TPA: hypothetical protein VHA09_06025, partial [Nitrososphaera sp.]|nr:hypothetical protein [Nitrososphaera sp.]
SSMQTSRYVSTDTIERTATTSPSKMHTIIIEQGASKQQRNNTQEPFSPTIMNVHTGDTVTWINEDSVEHTINSIAFNSSKLSPNGSASSSGDSSSSFRHTFKEQGIFLYYSKNYPRMAGVVYVDTEETERQLTSTIGPKHLTDVKIEMPLNSAYANRYGPFYIPVAAKVSEGNRITWENHDFIPHTATASDGSFDSGPIGIGKSFSTISTEKGIVPYYCKIHPWMQGIIVLS